MNLRWLVDSEIRPDLTEDEVQKKTAYVNMYLLTQLSLSDEHKRATTKLTLSAKF